jgi:hypothetical protein
VQRLDDMLGGARMAAHEHYGLGHALRRHVDVTDAYLADRLRHGTLLDEGHRAAPPASGMASAWTDLHTAEEWVTRTLRAHERELRAWAAGGGRSIDLELPATSEVGRVMRLTPSGSPELLQPNLVRVVLKRHGGEIYIHTAYPHIQRGLS